jgi:anti-sigma factor RsiW
MNDHLTTERLIDYLHGELDPAADACVLAHLEVCGACKHAFETEVALTEALHVYGRATEVELPGSVRGAVWHAVDQAARPAARIHAWLRPILGVGLAAAAAAAIAFGISPVLHRAGPAAIDAMYIFDDHAALRGSVPFNESNSGQQWLALNGSGDVAVDAVAH